MTHKQCRHYLISGKVQGVWFRASTKEVAISLGLTGWVKNTDAQGVEVVACGEPAALEQLATWLKKGPARAQVTQVQMEEIPWEDFVHFVVK